MNQSQYEIDLHRQIRELAEQNQELQMQRTFSTESHPAPPQVDLTQLLQSLQSIFPKQFDNMSMTLDEIVACLPSGAPIMCSQQIVELDLVDDAVQETLPNVLAKFAEDANKIAEMYQLVVEGNDQEKSERVVHIAHLQAQINAASHEISAMHQKLQTLDSVSSSLSEAQQNLFSSNASVTVLSESVDRLMEECKATKETLNCTNLTIQSQNREIECLVEKLAYADSFKQDNAELQSSVFKFSTELQVAQGENEGLMKQLETSKMILQTTIASHESALLEMKESLDEKASQVDQTRLDLQTAEIEVIKSEQNAMSEQLTAYELKLAESAESINTLTASIETLTQQNDALSLSYQNLAAQSTLQMDALKHEFTSTLNTRDQEFASYRAIAKENTAQAASTITTLNQAITDAADKSTVTANEIMELSVAFESTVEENTALKHTIAGLCERVEELTEESSGLNETLQTAQTSISIAVDALNTDIALLNTALTEKDREMSVLQDSNADKEVTIEKQRIELETANAELVEMKVSNAKLVDAIATLNEQIATLDASSTMNTENFEEIASLKALVATMEAETIKANEAMASQLLIQTEESTKNFASAKDANEQLQIEVEASVEAYRILSVESNERLIKLNDFTKQLSDTEASFLLFKAASETRDEESLLERKALQDQIKNATDELIAAQTTLAQKTNENSIETESTIQSNKLAKASMQTEIADLTNLVTTLKDSSIDLKKKNIALEKSHQNLQKEFCGELEKWKKVETELAETKNMLEIISIENADLTAKGRGSVVESVGKGVVGSAAKVDLEDLAQIKRRGEDATETPNTRKKRVKGESASKSTPKPCTSPSINTLPLATLKPSQLQNTPSKTTDTSSKHYFISFSGFKDGPATAFTNDAKTQLSAAINALPNTTIIAGSSDEYDPRTTHIIAPVSSRTVKTFGASLSGKWIISDPQWVFESLKNGAFVGEEKYGVKFDKKPFVGKKYFITPEFERENAERAFRCKYIRALIGEVGGGSFVEKAEDADVIVNGVSSGPYKEGVALMDWSKFVALIPQAVKTE